jgi:hypothetical protein
LEKQHNRLLNQTYVNDFFGFEKRVFTRFGYSHAHPTDIVVVDEEFEFRALDRATTNECILLCGRGRLGCWFGC